MKNPVYHLKTKHIRRWYHFTRRAVDDGDMCLQKIEGEKNPLDMLTKCVDVETGVMQNFGWSSVVFAIDVAVR